MTKYFRDRRAVLFGAVNATLALPTHAMLWPRMALAANDYTMRSFPILDDLDRASSPLSAECRKWLATWRGKSLEDSQRIRPDELSGSTSINLKLHLIEPNNLEKHSAFGTFVATNSSANPSIEIAYFGLAAILGRSEQFRPTVRYELGPIARRLFEALLRSTSMTTEPRRRNRDRLLSELRTGKDLKGCLKAKKPDSEIAYDALIANRSPSPSNPLVRFIQAGAEQPTSGQQIELRRGYVGNALDLSRQLSLLLTLDVVFEQSDRYSGGNLTIMKNESSSAQFYSTDNGGANFTRDGRRAKQNLQWISRFDRQVTSKLREVRAFLAHETNVFLNYSDAEKFVVDLGLYFELTPSDYALRLRRNIDILLRHVATVEARHGAAAYFV